MVSEPSGEETKKSEIEELPYSDAVASVVLISAQSGDSIQTGIFSRLPAGQ